MEIENIKIEFLEKVKELFLTVDVLTTMPEVVRKVFLKPAGKIGIICADNEISYDDYGKMTKQGGLIWQWATGACLVTVYHLWEEDYRKQIATIWKTQKNKIGWDLMKTIKNIRNSIIHDKQKANRGIENKTLKLQIKKGNPIIITEESWQLLIVEINKFDFQIVKQKIKILEWLRKWWVAFILGFLSGLLSGIVVKMFF